MVGLQLSQQVTCFAMKVLLMVIPIMATISNASVRPIQNMIQHHQSSIAEMRRIILIACAMELSTLEEKIVHMNLMKSLDIAR
jgi:hypothetical protein